MTTAMEDTRKSIRHINAEDSLLDQVSSILKATNKFHNQLSALKSTLKTEDTPRIDAMVDAFKTDFNAKFGA